MIKLRKIYYWLLIVRLSTRWVFRLNIGDDVIYQGKIYTLTQGVMNHKWNMSGNGEYLENIHRDNFKKVKTIKNYVRSFNSGYRFYMQNWYGIWCRNGIQDWMRGCNIWGRK